MSANPATLPVFQTPHNSRELLGPTGECCTWGPLLCDSCLRLIALKCSNQLLFREFEAARASDAFYVSWLGSGKPLSLVDDLRQRTIELCHANDMAELMVEMDSKPRSASTPTFHD